MNAHHITRSRSIPRHLIARSATAAVAAAALVGVPALPASAQPQAHPIAGDVVTCTIAGATVALVGASGHTLTEETTRVDAQGRARSLFTIRTSHARLTGPDGTPYRLIGGGFDRVLSPTDANPGDVLREHILFHFDVIGPAGRVGVVRFSLRAEAGSPPAITDSSTCQLPEQ
jgi:hypothetical protein